MRTKLKSNDEVCHYWANKIQSHGNTENLFFSDDEIYSYGSHFLAAKHYPKYNDTVLINENTYSSSTAQHLSKIRSASSHLTCFVVPNPSNCKDVKNMQYFINNCNELIKKAARARKDNKAWYLQDAKRNYDLAHYYKKTFKIRNKIQKIDFSSLDLDSVKKELQEKTKKLKAEKKIKKEAELKELKEKIEAWKNLESNNRPYTRYNENALLRVNHGLVETSQGSNVPTKEARILCLMIKNNKDITGKSIGHYTVKSYDGKKLVINCHTIEQSEIDYISSKILTLKEV